MPTPTPGLEPALPFDVGEIAREIQTRFRLFAKTPASAGQTNLATPTEIRKLLDALVRVTQDTQAKRATLSEWMPDAAIAQWDSDMAKWKDRLLAYHQAIDASAPGDRQAILWDVTAPLLLGFFGGPDSKLPQQPIDAVTPFSLANQLSIDDAWRDERLRLFREDVKEAAKSVGLTIAGALLAVGLAWVAAHAIANRAGR